MKNLVDGLSTLMPMVVHHERLGWLRIACFLPEGGIVAEDPEHRRWLFAADADVEVFWREDSCGE